jgi:molybdopterin converting factor subunit 1
MQILLFAGLAELAGCRTRELDGARVPATVGELEAAVRAGWPGFAGRPFRVAVNQRYGAPDDRLAPEDEVALIPPVSGG